MSTNIRIIYVFICIYIGGYTISLSRTGFKIDSVIRYSIYSFYRTIETIYYRELDIVSEDSKGSIRIPIEDRPI